MVKIDSGLTTNDCPFSDEIAQHGREIVGLREITISIRDNHLTHIADSLSDCKTDLADVKGQLKIILGLGSGLLITAIGIIVKVLSG